MNAMPLAGAVHACASWIQQKALGWGGDRVGDFLKKDVRPPLCVTYIDGQPSHSSQFEIFVQFICFGYARI
jgi:hypothetical protein